MQHYFTTAELCIQPNAIPQEVADKLWKFHILPMNAVRHALGAPITASEKSGYRPVQWERRMGRNGLSQHCFQGQGAVDWTTPGGLHLLDELQSLLIELTTYTRIARYATFIHCDYKTVASGKRQLFRSNAQSQWTLLREWRQF